MVLVRLGVLLSLVFSPAAFGDEVSGCVDYSGTYIAQSGEKLVIEQSECDTIVLNSFRSDGVQDDRESGKIGGAFNRICSFPRPDCRYPSTCVTCLQGFARLFNFLPTEELEVIVDMEAFIRMRQRNPEGAPPVSNRYVYQFTDASKLELSISTFRQGTLESAETLRRANR